MRKPDFYIVGQTRSGTNSLQFQLEQHPEIFMSNKIKTMFGFKKQVNSEKEYFEQFSNIKEKIIGERNTDYLLCPSSASKIKNSNPNAKIIIILRNPIDVMYSLHSTAISRGIDEDILDFEQALHVEEKRIQEEKKNPGKYNPFIFYKDVGKYSKQITRYLELFEREKILILKFEEFIKKPLKNFEKMCKFLEIGPDFKPKIETKNQFRGIRNKSLQNLADNIQKTSIGKILVKKSITNKIYTKINRPIAIRDELKPDIRKKIMSELKPDIVNLSKILKINFTDWCN
jgi:hypothetical protein